MGRKRKTTDVISLVSQCHSSPSRSQKQITMNWFAFFCYSWRKKIPLFHSGAFGSRCFGNDMVNNGKREEEWDSTAKKKIQNQHIFPSITCFLTSYGIHIFSFLSFSNQTLVCFFFLFFYFVLSVSLPSLISPNSTAVADQGLAFLSANHFCPPSSRLRFLCLNVPISLCPSFFCSCFHSPFQAFHHRASLTH